MGILRNRRLETALISESCSREKEPLVNSRMSRGRLELLCLWEPTGAGKGSRGTGPGCGPAWEMLPPAAHSALSRDEGEVQLPRASFRSD